MTAFLRDNLPYKIAALIFAILLHLYVVGQQAPARMMTVPLLVRNLPPNLILSGDAPRQVLLTLTGPADDVDAVALSDVSAYIDLAHIRSGKNMDARVQVKTPDSIQADPSPEMVTLSLLPRETRRLAVTAADPGPALPGYRFEAPLVAPRFVTVSGSQDAVDSVERLVVKTDAPTALGSVDGDFDIVALDAQGSQVADVTVTPAQAHVLIRMVSAPAVKDVPLVPDIVGALPPSVQITGTDVRPRMVLISGLPSRLAQINFIGTAPVDISGAATDVTRTVNCVAPPGVNLSGVSAAAVTVHIGPANGAVATPTVPNGALAQPPQQLRPAQAAPSAPASSPANAAHSPI